MNMSVDSAYERSLHTVSEWVRHEVNTTKQQVFFRTYAPVHFRSYLNLYFPLNFFCSPVLHLHLFTFMLEASYLVTLLACLPFVNWANIDTRIPCTLP